MRQGKKSPSIWASSQPTIEMKWKSKPVKGCMSNASIVFYEFGMLESKSACRPRSQHSTCSTEICVEIIRLFIHKCYVPQLFFFSRSSLLSIQLLVVASTHDSAVTQALPTSVSAFHELPAKAKWREKTEHNNKLMFNVSPGKFIAFSVRSKIAKMWMDINRAGKMIAMHETKEDNDIRTLE